MDYLSSISMVFGSIFWLLLLGAMAFTFWMLYHAWTHRSNTGSFIDCNFWVGVVFFTGIFGALYYYFNQYRKGAVSQMDSGWSQYTLNPSQPPSAPQYPPVRPPPVQYSPVQSPPVQRQPITPPKVPITLPPKAPPIPVMDDFPRQKLKEIIAKYGSVMVKDPAKVKGLLLDYCASPQSTARGSYQKEIHILTLAIAQNIPQELLSISANEPFEFKRGRLQKRLTDLATDEAAAKWAVESWAEALGVIEEDKK